MVRISGTQKKLGVALSLLVGVFVLGTLARFYPSASNQGYAPEQPIPFSHKLHAGDKKIDCQYCHSTVDRSRHASIPTLKTCFNCHTAVKTDSPYIQKMKKSLDEGKPIEWIRVHKLPDYVYFSHKRHIAQGLACEVCHGNVKGMVRVEQKTALTMGQCMECHRGTTTPIQVKAKIHPHVKNHEGPVANVSCNTCHN